MHTIKFTYTHNSRKAQTINCINTIDNCKINIKVGYHKNGIIGIIEDFINDHKINTKLVSEKEKGNSYIVIYELI